MSKTNSIISILLLILLLIFAIQNVASTQLKFLFWDFNASLALVIFITLIIGILSGIVLSLSTLRKRKKIIKEKDKIIKEKDEIIKERQLSFDTKKDNS